MKLKNILIIFIFASLFRNINLNAVQLNSLNYELSVYFIANSQQSVSSSNYNLNWSLDYLNNPGSSPISSSNYQFYSGAQYMFLNNSPVLIIGDTVIYSYSGNPITLNANGSFDPDSSPIQFVWSQSAGPQNFDTSIFQNSSNITIVPNISGTYIFTITVTDSDLSSVSETITAFINSSSAKSVIIETGQFQVKSINAYSDTISFYGIDEFGNLANDIAYSLQLVYPKFFSETISYDTVMSNNSVKLNLRVPSKPGSYIFALSTANDSKFIEIETPEREFYKNQWSMFTPIHESGNLYNLLSEITNNSIYQWNPASEDDEYGSKYKIPSNFEKGKSYWFKYTGIIGSENDTLTIAPTGNIIKDSSVTINLYAGWNQIGNPFYYYINWDSCLINNLSPAQAEAQNIIQNAFYWFSRQDNGKYGYIRTPDIASGINGFLKPYFGGWIFAKQNCYLTYNGTPSIPDDLFLQTAPSKLSPKRANQNAWFITLNCSTDKSFDGQNHIGVSENAVDAEDNNDKLKAPGIAGYAELILTGINGTKRYSTDFRKPFENYRIWDVSVSTDLREEKITINWNNISNLPENFIAYLEDCSSGKLIDMKINSEYSFISEIKRSSTRNFKIKIGTADYAEVLTKKALSASEVYAFPNPLVVSRDGSILKFNAAANSNINLKIFDISGEKVIELSQNNLQSNVFEWDLKNGAGKEISSGIYLYIIEIIDGLTKISKNGKFAVIK